MIPKLLHVIPLLVVYILVNAASAAEPTSAPEEKRSPMYVYEYDQKVSESTIAIGAARFYLGSFDGEENPGKLENENRSFTLGFGASFKLPKRKHLSFDLEFWWTERDYDTTIQAPLFSTISDSMTLQTMALLFGIRGFYPSDGRFRIYGTGGFGIYKSELSVWGSTLGLPGTIEDEDQSFGLYAGVGLEVDVGDDWFLGADYRHWIVEGSFATFGADNVDIGGNYIGISLGKHF
jgi:opacity protein-like surface antigen